jgi:hypothetical protein
MRLIGKADQNADVPRQTSLPRTESRDFSKQDDASFSNATSRSSFNNDSSSCYNGKNLTQSYAGMNFRCASEHCLVPPIQALSKLEILHWSTGTTELAPPDYLQESLVVPRGQTHERYHNKSSQTSRHAYHFAAPPA